MERAERGFSIVILIAAFGSLEWKLDVPGAVWIVRSARFKKKNFPFGPGFSCPFLFTKIRDVSGRSEMAKVGA